MPSLINAYHTVTITFPTFSFAINTGCYLNVIFPTEFAVDSSLGNVFGTGIFATTSIISQTNGYGGSAKFSGCSAGNVGLSVSGTINI